MQIADIISLALLAVFGAVYILKLVLLKKRNKIDANVLTKGNKGFAISFAEITVRITSSLWLLTWICEMIFHNQITSLVGSFFMSACTTYVGLAIIALGVGLFISATIFMKASWRVGIDKNTKTALITNGVYRFSRNPAFTGFDLMFSGMFIVYANVLTLFVLIINVIALHLLILQEEKHLYAMIGKEYEEYRKAVPRYFLIF
jgi:protein-S-isoprenylcysteine O-methyltransferase Ste14